MRLFAKALICALAVVPLCGSARAETGQSANNRLITATTFQPAELTYRVSLLDGSTTKYISAEGTFTDKASFSCDGWSVAQRLYVKLTLPPARDGTPVLPVYLRTGANAFEARNGAFYTFEEKSSMGGQMISSRKGEARLAAAGQAGTATYQDPPNVTVPLPAGTVFPLAYAYNLVSAAGRGESLYESNVFDGSMGAENGVLKLSSVISLPTAANFNSRPQPKAQNPFEDTDMGVVLAWPVLTKAFPLAAKDNKPVMVQGLRLLANGHPERIVLDFSEFKLVFDLAKIDPIPTPDCP